MSNLTPPQGLLEFIVFMIFCIIVYSIIIFAVIDEED